MYFYLLVIKKENVIKKDFDYLKQINSNIAITIPNFEIENGFIEMQLVPGVYELSEINTAIKQIISKSKVYYGTRLFDMSKFKTDMKDFIFIIFSL